MTDAVSGVVLAGGYSRRMGQEKSGLLLNGRPLIAHVLAALRTVARELLIVTNDARKFSACDARVVEDLRPGTHALGGLYTGLLLATHDVCFVAACDAPFRHPPLMRRLRQEAGGYDLVIPRTLQGLQPLHAVYRRTCLPAIAQRLRERRWDLRALASSVATRIIEPAGIHRCDPEERSFWNLNTPDDYAAASRIVHAMT